MQATLIGCKVLTRELYKLCAVSPNCIEIRWMKAALHETPGQLLPALQQAIDAVEEEEGLRSEAILLGFGLCSMGIVGLTSKRLPLVVPRAHDCISLLLGSAKTYRDIFEAHNGGVYWYSPGWIEQFKTPGKRYDEQAKYADYVLKYGEDNAQYLIEMEKSWVQHYDCAALIDWEGLARPEYEAFTRRAAQEGGLDYLPVRGSENLLKKLVDGDWDDDFVVCKPGQRLTYVSDERILEAVDL